MTNNQQSIQKLMDELLNSCKQDYGLDDNTTNLISNIASSFMPPINTDKSTEDVSSSSPVVPTDMLGNMSQMMNVFNSLNANNKLNKNKSCYDTINKLYNTLWNSDDLKSLETLYSSDAKLAFTSDINSENKWEMNTTNEIMNYYQNLWLPYIKNQETEVLCFSFDLDESLENVNVKYTTYQSQMDMNTMKWRKYHIEMVDSFTINLNDFRIESHQMRVTKRTPMDV